MSKLKKYFVYFYYKNGGKIVAILLFLIIISISIYIIVWPIYGNELEIKGQEDVSKLANGDSLIDRLAFVAAMWAAYAMFCQIRSQAKIEKINLLNNINTSFYNQEDIAPLYNYFEYCYRCMSKKCKSCKDCEYHRDDFFCSKVMDYSSESFPPSVRVKYCTIFSIIYNARNDHLINPEDLIALFSYRFLIMACNPWMQKVELNAPHVENSYREIFSLYEMFSQHPDNAKNYGPFMQKSGLLYSSIIKKTRKKGLLKKGDKITFRCEETYVIKKNSILRLEKRAKRGTTKEIYIPLTREDIKDSKSNGDFFITVYHKKKLVAFALLVAPRKCERNLSKYFSKKLYSDVITIDAVFVHPSFRGYGLQRDLLTAAAEKAKESGAKYIMALVSPKNTHSYCNFIKSGFKNFALIKKDDYLRYVVYKTV